MENIEHSKNGRQQDLAAPGSWPRERPSYYIGIAGSAGGFETLRALFEQLPERRSCAYIIIQNLAPQFKNPMIEALARHTRIPVCRAEDGQALEAGTAYVIPPGQDMLLAGGRLLLAQPIPGRKPHLRINAFFKSLAKDQRRQAVGIILSGIGSDGGEGLRAIKEAGGFTIVQDPGDAKFDSMPLNAVNTGLADVIVRAKDIPERLAEHMRGSSKPGTHAKRHEESLNREQTLRDIFELLRQDQSFKVSDYKERIVVQHIEARVLHHGLGGLQSYLRYLQKHTAEQRRLRRDIAKGVNRFYLDQGYRQLLTERVVTDLLDSKPPGAELRLWVIGCGSGEEAYSLAIILDQTLRSRGFEGKLSIFATDADEDAIAAASTAKYAKPSIEGLAEDWIDKYFRRAGGLYLLDTAIRDRVVFAVHNVLSDPPFPSIDLVISRNTIQHFQYSVQKLALAAINYALKPTGLLILGATASQDNITPHFECLDAKYGLFRKNPHAGFFLSTSTPHADRRGAKTAASNLLHRARLAAPPAALRQAQEALINLYVPPCLLVNPQGLIEYVYGDVSPFTKPLMPGRFSNHVVDTVHESIAAVVSAALRRCANEQRTVKIQGVGLTSDTAAANEVFDIVARYFQAKAAEDVRIGLLFVQTAQDSNQTDPNTDIGPQQATQRHIADLERELVKVQGDLQQSIEELEKSNEIFQESNDYLLAANEELRSSNEELESINEELHAVTAKYADKIQELLQANADLEQLYDGTDSGMIVLDAQGRICRFTAPTTHYLPLRSKHIDQVFQHVSRKFAHQALARTLNDDMEAVRRHGKPLLRKFNDPAGRTLLLRTAPYPATAQQDTSGATHGLLIVITDLSALET